MALLALTWLGVISGGVWMVHYVRVWPVVMLVERATLLTFRSPFLGPPSDCICCQEFRIWIALTLLSVKGEAALSAQLLGQRQQFTVAAFPPDPERAPGNRGHFMKFQTYTFWGIPWVGEKVTKNSSEC